MMPMRVALPLTSGRFEAPNGGRSDQRRFAADRQPRPLRSARLRSKLQERAMSDIKRSTAEFQRPLTGAMETATPVADTSASRQTRKLQRTAALWRGAEERGGDPYNATGRHAMGPRATSD